MTFNTKNNSTESSAGIHGYGYAQNIEHTYDKDDDHDEYRDHDDDRDDDRDDDDDEDRYHDGEDRDDDDDGEGHDRDEDDDDDDDDDGDDDDDDDDGDDDGKSDDPSCNQTINGTDQDDELHGSSGDDTILGKGGNDAIYGEEGCDTLDGGAGCDVLNGGSGADTYVFDIGHGVDVINDCGVPSETDIVEFSCNIGISDVCFSLTAGDDLLVTTGSDSSITIQDWFASANNQIEQFTFEGSNLTLSNTQINSALEANGYSGQTCASSIIDGVLEQAAANSTI